MATMPTLRPRRTQQQRREETIGRLLDATADALYEVGYAHTTVQEICSRAGLSQGALFRHFPTRRAVLAATANRVAEVQVQAFRARFDGVVATPETMLEALRELRELTRSRNNQVWHELVHAARTDEKLRREIQPALREYRRRSGQAASEFAGSLFASEDDLRATFRICFHYFDGEAAAGAVVTDTEREEQSLQILTDLVLSRARVPSPSPN